MYSGSGTQPTTTQYPASSSTAVYVQWVWNATATTTRHPANSATAVYVQRVWNATTTSDGDAVCGIRAVMQYEQPCAAAVRLDSAAELIRT